MKQHAAQDQHYGCIHPALLDIEIKEIVTDELHLMLRVSDVLIRNLIWAMIERDIKEDHYSRSPQFLDKLVDEIRKCGLTFRVSLI